MEQDLVVSKSIEINSGLSRVWDALTKPEIIKDYLFGTETITDWKVGSEIIFQGVYDGQRYQDKGIVCENIPNELISYNYWSGFSGHEDIPENYTVVTYNLKKIDNNKTKLTWTQKGFPNEKACKQSGYATEAILASIKSVIEKK